MPMASSELLIVDREIGSIKPYEKNPRKNDRAVKAVAASIKEFGFQQPIVVDEQGVIIVGHTRWKAAQLLGLKVVPVHVAVGMSPVQVAAYRIADNKTNELSDWEPALLVDEIKALRTAEYGLATLGFSVEELGCMLAAPPVSGLIGLDDVPATSERAKLGDLWLAGEHRLLVGDPGSGGCVSRSMLGGRPKVGVLLWSPDVVPALRVAPVDVAYVWHDVLSSAACAIEIVKAGFEIRAQLLALRSVSGSDSEYDRGYVPCWYAVKKGCRSGWGGDRKQSTVWDVTSTSEIPAECYERPFSNHGQDGDRVYATGAGLGAAVVAAEARHRVLVGIGAASDVDAALARWEAFTGKSAVLWTPT